MKKVVVIIGVVVLIIAGALYYYEVHKPVSAGQNPTTTVAVDQTSTSPVASSSLSFSCAPYGGSNLTAYENPAMGIAFCYPSDLTVTTNTITWPETYSDPLVTSNEHPSISFRVFNEASSSSLSAGGYEGATNLFEDIAGFAVAGLHGSDYTVPPVATEITQRKNQNGLNYILFRYGAVAENASSGAGVTVLSSNIGPDAVVSLSGQNYLAFSVGTFSALPFYVDTDLTEILSTLSSTAPSVGPANTAISLAVPPSCTLTANPQDARYHVQSTSTLLWDCSNAAACTINGNSASSTINGSTLKGSLVVPMSPEITDYTLNCSGGSTVVASDTVWVGDTAVYAVATSTGLTKPQQKPSRPGAPSSR